jgi:AcrR family transcriptional regulator
MAKRPAAKRAAGQAQRPGRSSTGARAQRSRPEETTQQKPHARSASADSAMALRRALLNRVATQGWRDLSYAEIAEEAGVPIAEAHRIYPSKAAILLGLSRALDEQILTGLEADPLEGSAKDRLFDLLMRRFDALKADAAAYRRLLRQLPATPPEFTAMLCRTQRSLALMLETAGISASGVRGAVRLHGLCAIYWAGLRAFANDDSEDLSKTMAEIDKRLGQAERLSEMFNRRRKAA